jgi:uncharacterized protein YdcH (DUF465 family)
MDNEFAEHEFKRLYERHDRLHDRMTEFIAGQARIEENLKEHMRRTELAEKGIEHLSDALKPIHKHVNHVEGGLKLIGLISMLIGISATVYKLFL